MLPLFSAGAAAAGSAGAASASAGGAGIGAGLFNLGGSLFQGFMNQSSARKNMLFQAKEAQRS